MCSILYCQLDLSKKLLCLFMVLLCITFLAACDSSTSKIEPTNLSTSVDSSESPNPSEESTDEKQEKPGVIRCAP
jgi:predicted component of type VI protein secretion system